MICPKCGSNQVVTQMETETTARSRGKAFDCLKSCLGFLVFNIPGLLCGFCGNGSSRVKTTTRTKEVHRCQNCGHRF